MVHTYRISLIALITAGVNAAGSYTYGYTSSEQADWQNLSSETEVCGTGQSQSPIDLSTSASVLTVDDILNNTPMDAQTLYTLVETNFDFSIPSVYQPDVSIGSHDVKVSLGGDNGLLTTYSADYETGEVNQWYLNQFHFHTPSEHTIDGQQLDFEMHMVHFNEDGSQALVLGILFDTSDDVASPFLEQFSWEEDEVSAFILDLDSFIDDVSLKTSWNYQGSLTTPPCSEIINWNVVREPMQMSVAQLEQYKTYFGGSDYIGNAREVQPLNGRDLRIIKQNDLLAQLPDYYGYTVDSNSSFWDTGLTEEENWAIDSIIIGCLLVLIGLIYITYFTYMIMTKKPENKKKTDEEVDDDDVKDVKA